MKNTILFILLIMAAGMSAVSCEKIDMLAEDALIGLIKKADVKINNTTTSKSTAPLVEITGHAKARVLDATRDVRAGQIIENNNDKHPTILGSVAYYVDGAGFLIVATTTNDANGNNTGETHMRVEAGNYTIK